MLQWEQSTTRRTTLKPILVRETINETQFPSKDHEKMAAHPSERTKQTLRPLTGTTSWRNSLLISRKRCFRSLISLLSPNFSTAVRWSSSIRVGNQIEPNKLIRKTDSNVGTTLELIQKLKIHKLLCLMENNCYHVSCSLPVQPVTFASDGGRPPNGLRLTQTLSSVNHLIHNCTLTLQFLLGCHCTGLHM